MHTNTINPNMKEICYYQTEKKEFEKDSINENHQDLWKYMTGLSVQNVIAISRTAQTPALI